MADRINNTSPIELKGMLTGTLAGSTAGAYAYFSTPYPGDGSFQSTSFSFTPNGPNMTNGIVVNVFQNGTQINTVAGTDNGSNPVGTLTIQSTSTTADPIVFQVGNYNPTGTISYSISH